MKIETVKVQNYRNLDGLEIALHEEVNFIIGENNLGKSNFLDLLDTIFNGTKFSQSDFANNKKPIIVDVSLKVTEEESSALGLEGKKDIVKIKVIQNSPDDRIELKDESSDKDLKYMGIRLANFIKYDPLRIPKDELNFYRNRGVGRFLSYIVQKVIANKAVKVDDVFNQSVLNNLINTMNECFNKIEHFVRYGIKASKDEEIKLEDIISEAVILKDSTDINITDAGAGLQFVILIILSILDKVKKIADGYKRSDNRKKDISMIVALDEPEIHLNPYLQRSLVKYLRRILNNEDSKFNELLKELFGIHSIKGQLIIVTHSPGVLLNDYKHYIRFYIDDKKKLSCALGTKVNIDDKERKHLLRNIAYVKEAFFSKAVVIVEGDSELGCVPGWISKCIGDLDDLGISVVKADGKESVEPLKKVLDAFNIKTIAIKDKDDNTKTTKNEKDGIFYTDKKDLEHELVEHLSSEGRLDLLFEIVEEFSNNKTVVSYENIKKAGEKYSIDVENTINDFKKEKVDLETVRRCNDEILKKLWLLAWLNNNKRISIWQEIGQRVTPELVPNTYTKAFENLKQK